MTEEKKENLEQEVVETPVQEEVVAEVTPETTTEEAAPAVAEEPAEVKAETAEVKETSAEPEEFDWASLEVGLDAYSVKERDKLSEMYNNTLNTVSEKEVLKGTVISLNKREVVVDIGYKSDGIVNINEFRYNPDLKVGDKVDVYI